MCIIANWSIHMFIRPYSATLQICYEILSHTQLLNKVGAMYNHIILLLWKTNPV
jgi:hypothetical protein